MRKTSIIVTALAVTLFAGSQKEFAPHGPGVAEELKGQAAEEIKRTFAEEVNGFFENGDLARTLGFTQDEKEQFEGTVKKYIDSYELDEEKLSEVKDAVGELLENAKGLSKEEIQEKLAAIFGQ